MKSADLNSYDSVMKKPLDFLEASTFWWAGRDRFRRNFVFKLATNGLPKLFYPYLRLF